ncbi:hypothetical protein [Gracilibacillus xinjiangensis]|uniref:DUF3221 domain-containing protein n=1 Tax=Gracilibacillus xinjiangensis TaxID=1193282 RepID=A0ABV8WYL8_9BACI
MKKLIILFILPGLLAACNHDQINQIAIGNPTMDEILKEDSNADVFVHRDIVYKNAMDVEWLTELEFKLGDQIGEISSSNNATHLPIETELYELIDENRPIIIAVVDDQIIPYLGMIEG